MEELRKQYQSVMEMFEQIQDYQEGLAIALNRLESIISSMSNSPEESKSVCGDKPESCEHEWVLFDGILECEKCGISKSPFELEEEDS